MSDIKGDLMAFVSDNGHVIGIGNAKPNTIQPNQGMAVAILRTRVTLSDWLSALNRAQDLLQAVESMVAEYGGQPIAQMIDLQQATLIPIYPTEVAEA